MFVDDEIYLKWSTLQKWVENGTMRKKRSRNAIVLYYCLAERMKENRVHQCSICSS